MKAVLASFLLLVPVGGAASLRRHTPLRRGPLLSVSRASQVRRADQPIDPAAVALALGGMQPDALVALEKDFDAAHAAGVRRAGLLSLDLDADEPPPSESFAEARRDLPALTAATNLAASDWHAFGLDVSVGDACAPGAESCEPVFAAAADELGRRGRAQAWALSQAAVVRVAPEAEQRVVERLQKGAAPGSIALVYAASSGSLDAEGVARLRRGARRALAHVAAAVPERAWLVAMSQMPDRWSLPIDLAPGEILIVPRLSSLAKLSQLEDDVAASGDVEWVVRPIHRPG